MRQANDAGDHRSSSKLPPDDSALYVRPATAFFTTTLSIRHTHAFFALAIVPSFMKFEAHIN